MRNAVGWFSSVASAAAAGLLLLPKEIVWLDLIRYLNHPHYFGAGLSMAISVLTAAHLIQKQEQK